MSEGIETYAKIKSQVLNPLRYRSTANAIRVDVEAVTNHL